MMQVLLAVVLFSVQAEAIFPFSDPRILFGSSSHLERSAGFPWHSNPFTTNSFSGVPPFSRNGLYSSSFNDNPCTRLTCGSNAYCTLRSLRPFCTCRDGYKGNPYSYCHSSKCVENSECPSHKICEKDKCTNPCSTSFCGVDAECTVRNHTTTCQCPQGFVGDPFTSCGPLKDDQVSGGSTIEKPKIDYCNPTPCGANTTCRVENIKAVCSCLEGFIGNPIEGCRRECESDFDCSADRACIGFRCKDPCGTCGTYAECEVRNHRPICSCPSNFHGDPLTRCYPECTTHDECSSTKACSNLKCVDSCIGACGIGAECRVKNHQAICSCPAGTTGHPFDHCRPIDIYDLCKPNPCGSNADCKAGKDERGNARAVCFCRAGYVGNPLVSCRQEPCIEHADCSVNKACCASPEPRTGIERSNAMQPLDHKKMSQKEYMPFFHPLLYIFFD